jgi:hypothetical protein
MRLPKLPRQTHVAAGSGSAEGWFDHDQESTVRTLRGTSEQLSPDQAALDRIYAASRRAFLEARLERSMSEAPARSGAPRRLRLALAFSVALLTLSGAGVVAAAESGPGEPFYRTRLAIEAIFLPGPGTPDRLAADLDRAQARLDEAARAAAGGNSNGAADALGAYGEIVASMAVPADEAARLRLRERLALQLVQLQALSVGGSTAAELGRAMERVGQLLDGSGQQPTRTPAPTDQGPKATPSREPGSSGDGPKASPSGGGPNPSANPGGQGGGQGSGAGGPSESQGPKAS